MKYRQEYEAYADYALERYLIEKEGYDEYDAKVKVMQDYDEVKKWFEETTAKSCTALPEAGNLGRLCAKRERTHR